MSKIHAELKKRRKALGLKQKDMLLRVGMARQQYQRLESNGNPRLDNLELVAMGLKMELMLIPQEKIKAVQALLMGKQSVESVSRSNDYEDENPLANDPWKGLLGEEE
ncbi:MAG: helix-turn-helix transcriptional regulator [Pseudomonadales bacterium]|nr:helix-turn-helix transcriptional regulator [Pseudomonadales bacterium]